MPISNLQTQPAHFISLEGTEGVGKSTAIEQLCQRLQAEGVDTIHTREPGGSDFAERLRDLLLDPATKIDDDTELLLMFSARCDHLHQVILPALQSGKWVVCDRFIDSTVAYQGFGRGQGNSAVLAKIDSLISHFVPRLPDLTLWLDLPVEEGLKRAGKRSNADRFEQETVDFFQRVRSGFDYMVTQSPQRVVRIEALGSVDTVADNIWQAVSNHLTS